jgi:hypothetical protein
MPQIEKCDLQLAIEAHFAKKIKEIEKQEIDNCVERIKDRIGEATAGLIMHVAEYYEFKTDKYNYIITVRRDK